MRDRFIDAARRHERVAQVAFCFGIAWIDVKRLAELGDGAIEIISVGLQLAKRQVAVWVLWVSRDRVAKCSASFVEAPLSYQSLPQANPCSAQIGLQFQGLLELL